MIFLLRFPQIRYNASRAPPPNPIQMHIFKSLSKFLPKFDKILKNFEKIAKFPIWNFSIDFTKFWKLSPRGDPLTSPPLVELASPLARKNPACANDIFLKLFSLGIFLLCRWHQALNTHLHIEKRREEIHASKEDHFFLSIFQTELRSNQFFTVLHLRTRTKAIQLYGF